jgi:predicted transcriptional regulator
LRLIERNMAPLPDNRPNRLSLGPLETEILEILWEFRSATTKDIYERILADPDRELTYSSVTTVLRRLTQKGWLTCDEEGRAFEWKPVVSREEAQSLAAHNQLQKFLSVSTPEIIAAFADSLDQNSLEQLQAIMNRIQEVRQQRRNP